MLGVLLWVQIDSRRIYQIYQQAMAEKQLCRELLRCIALAVGTRPVQRHASNSGKTRPEVARDGGMKPAVLEIAAKDGTTYRVCDLEAAAGKQATQDSNPWDEVLADAADEERST
jgi:hypothetical protein